MKVTFKANKSDLQKLYRMFRMAPVDVRKIQEEVYTNLGRFFVFRVKRDYLSRTCHSIKDLAEMGHPYTAFRGGGGGFSSAERKRRGRTGHERPGMSLGHPIWKIHKQGGQLYDDMIYSVEKRGNVLMVYAGIREGGESEKYAEFVHQGTVKMIRRPFLIMAFDEQKERMKKNAMRDMQTGVLKVMKENYGK